MVANGRRLAVLVRLETRYQTRASCAFGNGYANVTASVTLLVYFVGADTIWTSFDEEFVVFLDIP